MMDKTQIAKHFTLKKTNEKYLEVPNISITQFTTHDMYSYNAGASKNIYVLAAECHARIAMTEYEFLVYKDPKSAEAYIIDDLKHQIIDHVYGDIVKELQDISNICACPATRERIWTLISAIKKI